LPSTRPGTGTRPPIASTLPSTRPDGGRLASGSRPSQLPALGAGAALGAGIANRVGDRPTTLPGLGDRPSISQLPAGQRRDQLHDRLAGDGGFRDRPTQLPQRDWDQVRQDWADRRDDIRNDWQDHRDDVRDDWQDWHDDHYPWYGGWYWGYAPGYWGRWDYLWDEYPVAAAVGLTWWGVNSLSYAYGYGSDYYNPYYAESAVVDYSVPIVSEPAEVTDPAQESLEQFDQARAAFQQGNYAEALRLVDAAAVQLPRDAVLHEFRSLVLFALKRYSESAAAIHAVLAVGPGWDWKTLSSLYPDVATYTAQLRALEAYRNAHPNAADAWFLLGYHYLTTGSEQAALKAFRQTSQLQPGDTVSASLVRSLSPHDASQPAPVASSAAPSTPIPVDQVVGIWAATGKGTARYSMKLDKEGRFTWSFSRGTRKEEVQGVYALEGNVLAMEPDSGGVMLAEIAVKAPGSLHFKMVGGDKSDPGLDFKRSQ
jgi:tetratricopeptide (TPR) repeat protein